MQHILIKHIAILIFSLFAISGLSAQQNVGIGTDSPHPSVLLQISDSSRGVLIPRTDTMAVLEYTDGLNPSPGIANGLLIFDTLVNTYLYYEEVSGLWKNLLTWYLWMPMLNPCACATTSPENTIPTLKSL